ncbi:MAG: hypothetical protein WC099_01320 [Candidatus Paceibacterota bacterium]
MNKKGSLNIVLMVGVVIVLGIVGYFTIIQRSASPLIPTPTPTPPASSSSTPPVKNPSPVPNEPTTQNPSLRNNCSNLISYSAEAYLSGWKKTFQAENKLSDSQFNLYITISSLSLEPVGNTCELSVKYIIKKDWLSVQRIDAVTLGVPPTISPNNIPLENSLETIGRMGISTINLHDSFSFKSEKDALNFFIDEYNLNGTKAAVTSKDFFYFWDGKYTKTPDGSLRSAESGDGGKAYIVVSGEINSAQNKCYNGSLFLVSKKTTYSATPCFIN